MREMRRADRVHSFPEILTGTLQVFFSFDYYMEEDSVPEIQHWRE